MADIVPYKGISLERLSGRDLVRPGDLAAKPTRFYLAGNVYVGSFNQAGFVVVDKKPGPRPYWIGSEIMMGYTPEEIQKDIKYGVIKEEERYFFDTTGGLAALRLFALSRQLMDIFDRDRFLGIPMIRKMCEQGVVPDEFHELDARPERMEPIFDYVNFGGRELTDELYQVASNALRPVAERTGQKYEFFPYVTYFPPQAYPIVVPTLEESAQEVVSRFDEFGKRFGLAENYKELPVNTALTVKVGQSPL